MEPSALLLFLYTLGLFQKGLTDLIRTQRTVMAAEGDEVHLNCELMQFKEVVKVIWWKILNKGMDNLISQHKKYGQSVNPDFRDKVEFTDAGLQSSSIIIRNVTEQDEGCYCCLFKIHPGDDLNATTCLQLQLYELHEPVLHVGDSNSEETVVSCSATGRPAPTVTLTVPRHKVHFSKTSSVSVSNTNGTVTVTSTAVLTRLHDMEIEVRCAVRVLSGPQKEKIMMIPAEVKQSAEGSSWIIIVFSVVAFVCGAVLLIRKLWNSWSHRDPEEIKTPQTTNENTENKTPLMQKVNELIRPRTSAGKKRKTDSPTVSSSTAGTNRELSGDKTSLMQEENEHVRLTSDRK